MKKTFSKIVLLALCLTLTGCSKKDQMADYYEKELGMNKEEAQAFADAMNEAGMYGDTHQDNSTQKEEEASGFVLVKPSDQIVNSNITDPIVQVYNTVFSLDETMTVEECVNKLQADIGHELVLKLGNNYITFDSLDSGASHDYPISVIDKETEDIICYLSYINLTDASQKISECIVDNIFPNKWGVTSLNFFYAGNICKGIYTCEDKKSKAYQERLADYPIMTYEEIPQYLESQGFPYAIIDGTSYEINFLYSKPTYSYKGIDYYRKRRTYFDIDMNTATCSDIDLGGRFSGFCGEDLIAFNSNDFNKLSTKDVMKLGEAEKEFLTDSEVKFFAIKNRHDWNSASDVVFVYISEDGTYYYVLDSIEINADGTIHTGSDWSRKTGTASSLEEIDDILGCSEGDYTIIK